MQNRKVVSADTIEKEVLVDSRYGFEKIQNLNADLALPSYVHGYSLAIQYMYDWFRSKFPKDFFRGGIYIDGKNVLDDYNRLNEYSMRNIIKGQNPRARMEPRVEFDYDREGIDLYQAPPGVYLRRSNYQTSFFKDYDRNLYLGFMPRALRMNVNYKVRLNSRSQQLDTYNRMELYFRNGATQYEYISVDFHVPKYIMIDIADKAGFEIKDGEVVDIIDFINYLNRHSDLPFLFKLRAINQKSEFFIRLNGLYTHIAVRDKLQVDDGERDGKLDFNFHIEMNAVLDIPIPHFYSYYTAGDYKEPVTVRESNEGCIAVYSINVTDIPKTNELGWMQTALTEYMADEGDEDIDLSPIFAGDNVVARAIKHDLTIGISPAKFIDIKIFRDQDVSKEVQFDMDWKTFRANFKRPEIEECYMHIAIYIDREYINELDSELGKYKENRISKEVK